MAVALSCRTWRQRHPGVGCELHGAPALVWRDTYGSHAPSAKSGQVTFLSSISTKSSPERSSRSLIDMPRAIYSMRAVFCRSRGSTGAGSKQPCWPSALAVGAIGGRCRPTPSKVTRASFVKSSPFVCHVGALPAGEMSMRGLRRPLCSAGRDSLSCSIYWRTNRSFSTVYLINIA